jgi:hypothetical protein
MELLVMLFDIVPKLTQKLKEFKAKHKLHKTINSNRKLSEKTFFR